MNKTIIYYTANREDPVFEQKITDDMLSKAGDMIITVRGCGHMLRTSMPEPMDSGYGEGIRAD